MIDDFHTHAPCRAGPRLLFARADVILLQQRYKAVVPVYLHQVKDAERLPCCDPPWCCAEQSTYHRFFIHLINNWALLAALDAWYAMGKHRGARFTL